MNTGDAARFEARYLVDESGCWLWRGWLDRCGYGYFKLAARKPLAHRVSYEHHVGPIPDGLTIDHLCRNTRCVNPTHLEPVTNSENLRRRHAAKTHCKHGHAFTVENTRIDCRGHRNCIACDRARPVGAKRKARVAA